MSSVELDVSIMGETVAGAASTSETEMLNVSVLDGAAAPVAEGANWIDAAELGSPERSLRWCRPS